MPWKPLADEQFPTLGYQVIDWIHDNLAMPGQPDYRPYRLYLEQEDFLINWYRIDPATGRFMYQRGVIGRPRGWGKSPLLAAVCCVEALGPVVFDGWDSLGQPVGKPWSDIRRQATVQIAAVSEEQAGNTWAPLLEMLSDEAPVASTWGLDVMETAVILPTGGRIRKVTSSARTVKGSPNVVFSVLDQTEEWVPSNGGVRLANTMRSNAAKVGGRTLESPNAYIPGEGSVAEQSAAYWSTIREGRAKNDGLLYDHREATPDTDMSDRDSLIAGLRVSYGDSAVHPGGCVIHDPPCAPGHVDLDRIVATIWDPAQDVQQSRSDFLNQITHASDSWISQPDWAACLDLDAVLADGESVVLGFDGSKGRARGKADATALVGCRVSDGLLFEIRVWEQPDGPAGRDWTPNPIEVDAAVRGAFERWRVVGFYADPSGWGEHVARWEATYGRRLRVKATAGEPIAVWPRGKTANVTVAVDAFREAVVNGEIKHHGTSALTRHVLNARRRATRTGYLIYKAFPQSPDKIDAAYAAVMAWKARIDAVAMGITTSRSGRATFV